LNAGANPNEKDNDGSTPLHQAVASGRLDIVSALLKAKVDVNAKDATEATPLNLATMQKQDEIALLLLEHGADPNIPNEQAFTPLHYASAYGELKTASALIEKGANIKAVTKEMSTPLHQAAFNGHANVVKLLIEKGAEMEFGNSKALHLACFNGHAAVVKILLEKGAYVNCTDEELSTPLHKATYNGHVECLRILVEVGKADLNCKDAEGATPLHKAAFSAKDECLQYLLSKGAEVDSEDNCQGTSLHNAAFRGHATTAELLIKSKASINKGDDRGATPLHLAALGNGLDCLKFLIKQGANVEAIDIGGMTPLMYSVGHLDIVKYLLTQKLDVNRTDKKGRSALLHAIVKRHEEVAKVLIEHGADPNKKDNEGRIPIELVSPAFKEIINDAVKMRQKGAFDEKTQAKFAEAVKRFNTKPKTGVEYLISEGLADKNNFAQDMAFFLQKENDTLSRKVMGEYLGTKENVEVLKAFTNRLNFEGMEFDQALRVFLTKFRLPGEAQMIDRCMQRFSARYCENNPDFFPDEDTAYIIAFSLIMLHTDAHNPNVKDKMTKSQFIKNSHGFWAGQDPPQEFLERMYDSIIENEIKLDSDDLVVIEKKGWLKRQTDGRNKKWSPRYFVLKDQVLYYYKTQDDSDNPNGLIPLENVVVKPREEKKKIVRFALAAADGGPIKSCKMEKGKLMQGNHKELFFTAENHKDNEEWIEAIRGSIANNPFYHLITKRMEELSNTKSTNAAVNFQEIYDLALLCQSCATGDEAAIKDTYGPYVLVVDQVMGIKFMVITNGDYKRTQIVLTGKCTYLFAIGGRVRDEKNGIQRWVHGALGSTSASHAGGTGIEALCIQHFFLLFFLLAFRYHKFSPLPPQPVTKLIFIVTNYVIIGVDAEKKHSFE
jgi:ankyrin repeat protein